MTIPELTARIAALETSESNLNAKLAASLADIAAAQSLADEAQVKLTAELAKTAELAGKIATAESEAAISKSAAALAAKDLALAREQANRFGATAPKETDAGQRSEKQTMQLADFNAMPINERNKFMREGGKLAA